MVRITKNHQFKITTALIRNVLFIFMLLTIACHFNVPLKPPANPLRLGTNIWIGYETLYLARNLGYFKQLPIKMVELSSATQAINLFRNHTLEIAALTLDETLTLLQTETDLRIILLLDISNGADVLLVKPDITALADIKGKRIAVENTAVGAILLDGALQAANLTPVDITLVPRTVDEHLSAYLNDQVDAVITFEPVKTQLQKLGAQKLFDSSQIPERIVDVLVTRKTVIDSRSDDLKQLLADYFKALHYLRQNPQDAAFRMAPRMGIPTADVLPLLKGIKIPDLIENHRFLSGKTAQFQRSLEQLKQLMIAKKLLFRTVDTQSLLDDSLLPEH